MPRSGAPFHGYFFAVEDEGEVRTEVVRSGKKGDVGVIRGPREALEKVLLRTDGSHECFVPLCTDSRICPRIFGLVFGEVKGDPGWGARLLGVYRCRCRHCLPEKISEMIRPESKLSGVGREDPRHPFLPAVRSDAIKSAKRYLRNTIKFP